MVVHVGDSCLVANVKSGPRGLDAAPGAIRLLAGSGIHELVSQLPGIVPDFLTVIYWDNDGCGRQAFPALPF
jgi:hypothetical protein